MSKHDKESAIRNLTCWSEVEKRLDDNVQRQVKPKPRRGWNTIRIFVSSTFKDFHYERDVLVKKGAPKQFKDLEKLEMCLGELDRCYRENNQQPFFINMNSRRIGWIPEPGGDIPNNILEQYGLVFGFSITEMEIFHGAYKIQNPNAMFLLRNPSVFDTLPREDSEMAKKALEDFGYDAYAEKKLDILREKINTRFLKSHERKSTIIEYSARFNRFNEEKKVVLEIDDEDNIIEQIITFFKERIGNMYPPPEKITDRFKDKQLAHEAFMQFKDQDILGRDGILAEIDTYIHTDSRDVPLLLLGGPGTGKSSIMARAANNACKHVQNTSGDNRHVFYHFVGAVPGSTEPLHLLHRLLKEVGDVQENELPTDIDSAIQMAYCTLNHPQVKPVIIFIDALNQLDDNQQLVPLMNWVPRKLSEKVRCVFSMIPETAGTSHYKVLKDRESQPIELQVTDLDRNARRSIVTKFFERWTKILDDKQMTTMLDKQCSKNPLWLTIACEELRVHGNFRTMDKKLEEIKDDLLLLIEQVLERFENDSSDSDKPLLKATLCLIEVSKRGLLESELFYILGDKHLLPGQVEKQQEKGQKEECEKPRYTDMDRLPAFKWTLMTRSLGPFLRPFGDLGEGRLDFYHRSVSKAVRNK